VNNSVSLQPVISATRAQPDCRTEQTLPPLSCDIHSGDHFFLMGLDHSVTLPYLRMLAGVEPPISGQIHILGTDYSASTQPQRQLMRQKIGFVMEGGPLMSALNGVENLLLAARYHQLGQEKELQEKAKNIIAEFPHQADYRDLPAYMSILQRRLLAIARPLMLDPQVLFIDNPFDGLDQHKRIIVARYISNLANQRKITLVVSSDDLYFAHSLAHRIIFCDHDEAVVFDNWQAFYQSERESIALLFKHEHISRDG
jgi:ABC-type multidrug transport system ATPase subunit